MYSGSNTDDEVVIDLDLVDSSKTVCAGGAASALCSRSFTDWLSFHHYVEKYRSMFDVSWELEKVILTRWYERSDNH